MGSSAPKTAIEFEESATALPSRVNSGLTHTAKSTPARLPLAASKVGIARDLAVPGNIVLRRTTQWNSLFSRKAVPICSQVCLTLLRSNCPLGKLGVPTHTKDISDSLTAKAWLVVAYSLLASRLCVMSCSSPG